MRIVVVAALSLLGALPAAAQTDAELSALRQNLTHADPTVRLEAVQNANDQAAVAAKVIAGQPATYDAVPWFWSDQYDLKLQAVGLALNYDTSIVRGDPAARSFSVAYLRRNHLIALDCVNATRDYVQGRKLIVDAPTIDLERLSDPSIALKDAAIA